MKKLLLTTILFLGLASQAHADIETGLVAQYKFDEGSGTSATDSGSGANNALLVNSAGWTAGKVGPYALNLNATNARAEVSTSVSTFNQGSGSYSVAAWVYLTNVSGCPGGTDACAIISSIGNSGNGNQGDFFFGVRNQGELIFAAWQGSGSSNYNFRTNLDGATIIQDNTWYHVVGTWDGANGVLYINGTSQSQAPPGLTGSGDSLGAYIGTLWTGSDSYHLKGAIDELRIYNRALSSSDVTELYNYTGATTASYIPRLILNALWTIRGMIKI